MVIYLPGGEPRPPEPEPLPSFDELTPREIVVELDKYIVGQNLAKTDDLRPAGLHELIVVADCAALSRTFTRVRTRQRTRRLAYDQLAVEYDALHCQWGRPIQTLDENLGGASPQLVRWLGDGSEMRPECVGPGKWEIIEANQRNVVGHQQPAIHDRLEGADTHQVVAREDG